MPRIYYVCVVTADDLLFFLSFLLLVPRSHLNLHRYSSLETSAMDLKLEHSVYNGHLK